MKQTISEKRNITMEQPLQITLKFASSGRRIVSRVISAVILSLAVAFLLFQSEVAQGAMGKANFLTSQSVRYDKFLARPQYIVVIAEFITFCILFGGYELLTFVIYKIIAFRSEQEKV